MDAELLSALVVMGILIFVAIGLAVWAFILSVTAPRGAHASPREVRELLPQGNEFLTLVPDYDLAEPAPAGYRWTQDDYNAEFDSLMEAKWIRTNDEETTS